MAFSQAENPLGGKGEYAFWQHPQEFAMKPERLTWVAPTGAYCGAYAARDAAAVPKGCCL
jgi:hypothetical protein